MDIIVILIISAVAAVFATFLLTRRKPKKQRPIHGGYYPSVISKRSISRIPYTHTIVENNPVPYIVETNDGFSEGLLMGSVIQAAQDDAPAFSGFGGGDSAGGGASDSWGSSDSGSCDSGSSD